MTEIEDAKNEEFAKDEKPLIVEMQVKDIGACEKSLDITVSAADVQRAFDETLKELTREVTVPGFRRGKAPRHWLEKRFASDIQNQVSGKLLEKGFTAGLIKENLKMLGEPIIDVEKYKAVNGEPFTFNIVIEVSPTFELGNYKGIEIEQEEVELLPGELEDALATMRKDFIKTTDAPPDHALLSDEVLAQKLNYKTVDEMQQRTRLLLLQAIAANTQKKARQMLLDKILEIAPPFEMPKRMSEALITQIIQRLAQNDELAQATISDKDALMKKHSSNMRQFFVLQAICEKENISISDEDIDAEVLKQARYYGMRPLALYEYLVKEKKLEPLKVDLKIQKLLDYLMEQADIKVVPRKQPLKVSEPSPSEHIVENAKSAEISESSALSGSDHALESKPESNQQSEPPLLQPKE